MEEVGLGDDTMVNDDITRNDGAKDAIQADAMTVAQLKDELKRRKLKRAGNKAELVERLRAAMLLEGQRNGDESDNDDDDLCDQASCEFGDESESNDESEDGGQGCRPLHELSRGHERCLLTFMDVEDSIDTFSGDDGKNIGQWIRDFDETANLCQWNNVQKTIYVKRLLRRSARLFVKYEVRGRTWRDIRAALSFPRRSTAMIYDIQLQKRKKRVDETYHEYCYKMMEIASRTKLEISAVIQYIIDGIADDEVNKFVLYGAKSISDLKRKLDVYEMMKNKSKHSKTDDRKRKFVRAENDKPNDKRCYNCGNKNHLSAVCPVKEKGVKYFRCGEHGHIAAKCPTADSKHTNKDKNCNATQGKTKSCCKIVAINTIELSTLIDTGSDISLMRADSYVKVGAPALN